MKLFFTSLVVAALCFALPKNAAAQSSNGNFEPQNLATRAESAASQAFYAPSPGSATESAVEAAEQASVAPRRRSAARPGVRRGLTPLRPRGQNANARLVAGAPGPRTAGLARTTTQAVR